MKKKIVFITPSIGVGGAERQLALLARGLQKKNFRPSIISLSDQADYLSDFDHLDTHICPIERGLTLAKGLCHLRKKLLLLSPSIVQGWMYAGNIAASIASINVCRNIFHSIRASNMDASRYGLQIWINSKLSYFSSATIANSQKGLDYHLEKGFCKNRLQLIRNGVDDTYFVPRPALRNSTRQELGLREEDYVVLHVARLDPMKAHDWVMSAAKSCPHIKFISIGLGTNQLEVPKNVICLGMKKDMVPFYNASDCLVSWSHYGEGFPNVIVEAMACGLPVIANNVGDSWHLLGDTGLKSVAQTPSELAKDILLASTKNLQSSDKKKIVSKVVDNFSACEMVRQYEVLYQNEI